MKRLSKFVGNGSELELVKKANVKRRQKRSKAMATTKKTKKVAKPRIKTTENVSNKTKIAELLQKLKGATVQRDKKVIRRELRSLGHFGGLKAVKGKVS